MFEQLFSAQWITKRPWIAFLMGLGYSVLGIFSAIIVFPENVGLMAIAFTSLLVVLSLNTLLSLQENREIREKKFSFGLLFRDHKDIFEIYIFLFLGMLLVYSFFAIVLPQYAFENIFSSQFSPLARMGYAIKPGWAGFFDILGNNILVLFICVLLSVVYGAGSILFLNWNASVWGSVFGFFAKKSSIAIHQSPVLVFADLFVRAFPHMIVEASSYFFAVIAGGVVSKALIREEHHTERFVHVFTDGLLFFGIALVLLVLGAFLEVFIFPLL